MSTADNNARFTQTELHAGNERWYILDNAASFMPAMANHTFALVFRIAASLTERVDLALLAQAMQQITPRFPYYHVELRKGLFWYYFDSLHRPLKPNQDSRSPNLHLHVLHRREPLFRVRAFETRIAVEFSHVLADGSGALRYLQALLLAYAKLREISIKDAHGIMQAHESPDPQEYEDAFNRHFRDTKASPPTAGKAFHRPYKPLVRGTYRVTSGIVSLAALKSRSKAHGCTINEYLVAVYMFCLQEAYLSLLPAERQSNHPIIAVQVPVNLRSIFPSNTMRNFSLYVLPSIDMRLGEYGFEEIIHHIRSYMQSELTAKGLSRQISRNVSTGRSLGVRILPLFLKNLAARLVYKHIGEDTYSGFLSNLGPITLPEELETLVDHFSFIPTPSYEVPTNLNVASYKDKFVMCFGSVAKDCDIERRFFRFLSNEGLDLHIDSNMAFDQY